MGNIVHTSCITITRENDSSRKAIVEGLQDPIYYGVHGGIKKFYKVDPEVEHAATLDHIVGAVGGCLMGTFAVGLAARKIPTHTDRYAARVEGDIEDIDGVLRITSIRVDYDLKVPAGKVEEAREVFAYYRTGCPAYNTVRRCIDISDNLRVTELEPRRRGGAEG